MPGVPYLHFPRGQSAGACRSPPARVRDYWFLLEAGWSSGKVPPWCMGEGPSYVYPRRGAGSPPQVMAETRQLETGDFRFALPCEPASVPRVRARVSDWCAKARMYRDQILDIQLAVTEAASNAVLHSGCTELEIQGRVSGENLIVSVTDYGTVQHDTGPGLGVGIGIMRKLAESVDFDRTQSGTRVTMRFGRRARLADDPRR
jgi:anti-sigma regulatory factor (Ser/Thr protein kinase)